MDRISKALGITTIFTKDKVSLYKNNQSIIARYKNNSLYYILFTILYPKKYINACLNNLELSKFYKQHIRLGHINTIPLGILLSTIGIAISSYKLEEYKRNKYPTCILAKDKRYINKESFNKKEYNVLERIYSDIGGPLSPTYNNYRYYITFLDKKSRYLWLFLLRYKNKAFQTFLNYAKKAENNNNKKRIREFFSDNRYKYTNKCF